MSYERGEKKWREEMEVLGDKRKKEEVNYREENLADEGKREENEGDNDRLISKERMKGRKGRKVRKT